jgi:hypothetical protein
MINATKGLIYFTMQPPCSYHLKPTTYYKNYLMSLVSDTGRGCRFGWSELGGVEAEILLNCDLLSVDNLCVSRPWCWLDGEKSVSSAIEDKSEDEQLQNFIVTESSLNSGQAMAEQPTTLKSNLKLNCMQNVSLNIVSYVSSLTHWTPLSRMWQASCHLFNLSQEWN